MRRVVGLPGEPLASRCVGDTGDPPIARQDERATGLEGFLGFGGPMKLAVNQAENEFEVSEVTGDGSLDNILGDPSGVSLAVVSGEPSAKSEHDRATIGCRHDDPPPLS